MSLVDPDFAERLQVKFELLSGAFAVTAFRVTRAAAKLRALFDPEPMPPPEPEGWLRLPDWLTGKKRRRTKAFLAEHEAWQARQEARDAA